MPPFAMAPMDPTNSLDSTPSDRSRKFLFDRINYERGAKIPYRSRDFRLERMHELMQRLGNPQRRFPIVHVAGTKGKGSTATLIASILGVSGYRVGLYTSPHLERLEERFVVGGEVCSPVELTAMIEAVRGPVEQMDRLVKFGERGPTFFEITTAMAFQHFAQRQVDIAVIEVGLGGRLDSTNVCQPLVTAITSISFDHTQQLGNTLAKIAREKAGIIKPGIPIISGVTEPEPREIIESIAEERGAPLWNIGRDFSAARLSESNRTGSRQPTAIPPAPVNSHSLTLPSPSAMTCMHYWEEGKRSTCRFESLQLGLLGEHQVRNAAVSLAVVQRLREAGWKISPQGIQQGLAHVRCPARIEILRHDPTVVLDVAHNLDSIHALLHVLRENFPSGRRLLIFAASQDKDAAGMLRVVAPHFHEVILTTYRNNPRGVPTTQLRTALGERLDNATPWPECIEELPDPSTSWQVAYQRASTEDLICVTGSFFLAAEIRPAIDAVSGRCMVEPCQQAGT
jgi:dihydrofolate synthase / folylpolyglutamate synthase